MTVLPFEAMRCFLIVIPPKFDDAMPFCDGKAEAQLNGKMVTIDKTGAVVKPNPY